ncbi:MAG: preprotein translocase subunit SecG [Schleiferiaceae bacterium]|jgi:preprotein translocase subunit SecG|nr:preprotein translocase subunit SecG [Schleiferiaceae bacterium]MDR9441108.1 preprotein translocase subunit SecG [Schleiferiaceae bacterium]
MATFFAALIILVCILLIIIVLVQNPKGGGLSSSFGGGGTQVFGGVKKTTDFLDRGTWGLAIVLVVLVLFANVSLTPESSQETPNSRILESEEQAPQAPAQQPLNMPQGGGQQGQPAQQSQGQPAQRGQEGDLSMPESVEDEEQ